MEMSRTGGKKRMNENDAEDEDGGNLGEDDKKKRAAGKKGTGSSSAAAQEPCCQVENCTNDMSEAKQYHRRHKVCQFHAKVPVVVISGVQQRFCQQCSRFHDLSEFDDTKRSCRRRLAGHNERRRKSSYESSHGEGSGLT